MQVLSGLGLQLRSTIASMSRRKGEDTTDKKRRRMPFVAKIRRADPFRMVDQREIYGMCRRIAAASEFMSLAGWREDAGFLVYHFTTWAKARAMQHWIDRSDISKRPMPKVVETQEELAARRARFLCAAYAVASKLDAEPHDMNSQVDHVIEWAKKNHAEWFNQCRPEPPPPRLPAKVAVAAPPQSAPAAGPIEFIPRTWRPTF